MSAVGHDQGQLAAYVLGGLTPVEAATFEAHLANCPTCRREVRELAELRYHLDEVPPEAFLEGPPDGGDLLLQRTLRQVRDEEDTQGRKPRRFLAVAGAAVLVVVALGAGVLVGRQTSPEPSTVALPVPTATAPVPGTRDLAATDRGTGAQLAVRVVPAAGWVRLHAKAEGVREGEKCQLVVVTKSGERVNAGSWLVSKKGEREGTGIDGSALVAPDDVASVDVVTLDGRNLVSARV
ncbi:anti-sigma factor family protein [Amycolatopsis regifaucium]|uniref:Anti-sigma factor n=1 Tax=Amycolatopsis regifaucium TaxID=546365 RepID=A0A154MK03_9PSEU|nr:zf-HC2 domain-containing protein [Amycolatopsis regifaucium]KZB84237.1 anti-sigma factor [Amycolatopsis regifaucium]OKA03669.1 anti-sigma factor [Amycolatopsis regifaucium]SFJ22321.1 Putative zinc-finger [Amycolatopsis regifaucium]